VKILFLSNLFPNAHEPTRGIFNAQQVAALAKSATITKIIAPSSRSLRDEVFNGILVVHPRVFRIPLLTRPFNGKLYARSVAFDIRHSSFDIVLVNWAYPDAYGVMLLARELGFRFATTVQGSDVNVLFESPARKQQVLQALRSSSAVFTRSDALRKRLATEGIQSTTVYNGVDRERFHSIPRAEACRQLGLPENRRRILYVGNLQKVKGPTVLARAFPEVGGQRSEVGDTDLLFIGDGPERNELLKHKTIRLLGSKPHSEIPIWMNACDALCLPSFNEGLPNVCIEAAACGLPVVASNVGGVPEVVKEGVNGFLVPAGDPAALSAALQKALSTAWNQEAIRSSVARFDWDENARVVHETLQRCVA
jgi:glycosyltransferase involved in cell wall biosynthesis